MSTKISKIQIRRGQAPAPALNIGEPAIELNTGIVKVGLDGTHNVELVNTNSSQELTNKTFGTGCAFDSSVPVSSETINVVKGDENFTATIEDNVMPDNSLPYEWRKNALVIKGFINGSPVLGGFRFGSRDVQYLPYAANPKNIVFIDSSVAAPTTGQVLKWDGSGWVPGTDNSGMSGIGAQTIAGSLTAGVSPIVDKSITCTQIKDDSVTGLEIFKGTGLKTNETNHALEINMDDINIVRGDNFNVRADLNVPYIPTANSSNTRLKMWKGWKYEQDTLVYNNISDFPTPGATNKVYFAKNEPTYYWMWDVSSSSYIHHSDGDARMSNTAFYIAGEYDGYGPNTQEYLGGIKFGQNCIQYKGGLGQNWVDIITAARLASEIANLHGTYIPMVSGTSGQVLKWVDGSGWTPGTDNSGGGTISRQSISGSGNAGESPIVDKSITCIQIKDASITGIEIFKGVGLGTNPNTHALDVYPDSFPDGFINGSKIANLQTSLDSKANKSDLDSEVLTNSLVIKHDTENSVRYKFSVNESAFPNTGWPWTTHALRIAMTVDGNDENANLDLGFNGQIAYAGTLLSKVGHTHSYIPMVSGTSGQVLTWVGNQWTPTTISGGSGNATQLQGNNISSTTPTDGQALLWVGNQWTPGTVSGGGSTNATQIQGRNVSSAYPTAGQVLKWNPTGNQWEPSNDNTGSGGGVSLPINISDVTGLQTALDSKANTSDLNTKVLSKNVIVSDTGYDESGTHFKASIVDNVFPQNSNLTWSKQALRIQMHVDGTEQPGYLDLGLYGQIKYTGQQLAYADHTHAHTSITDFDTEVSAKVGSSNAATATKLATARNINGVAFDGTSDITIPNMYNYLNIGKSFTITGMTKSGNVVTCTTGQPHNIVTGSIIKSYGTDQAWANMTARANIMVVDANTLRYCATASSAAVASISGGSVIINGTSYSLTSRYKSAAGIVTLNTASNHGISNTIVSATITFDTNFDCLPPSYAIATRIDDYHYSYICSELPGTYSYNGTGHVFVSGLSDVSSSISSGVNIMINGAGYIVLNAESIPIGFEFTVVNAFCSQFTILSDIPIWGHFYRTSIGQEYSAGVFSIYSQDNTVYLHQTMTLVRLGNSLYIKSATGDWVPAY